VHMFASPADILSKVADCLFYFLQEIVCHKHSIYIVEHCLQNHLSS